MCVCVCVYVPVCLVFLCVCMCVCVCACMPVCAQMCVFMWVEGEGLSELHNALSNEAVYCCNVPCIALRTSHTYHR